MLNTQTPTTPLILWYKTKIPRPKEDFPPAIIKIIMKRRPLSILSPASPQFMINKETDNNNNSKHIKT